MPNPASLPAPTASTAPKARTIDRITSPAGLVLSAALVGLILPVTSAIRDPDFWWHLRAGQILLATHRLIATDPFTYTVPTHTWTMHEWATEVSFAWLHDVAGLASIVVVLAVITWLGLLAVFMRSRLDSPSGFVLAAGMVMAGLVGYPIWGPRVQMLTFALASLVLLLAEQHLRRGGRWIWLLVPLFLVWSNFHSGFVIGIAFLLVVAVAELVGHRLRWPGGEAPSRARTLLLVAGAGVLAAMFNPNGPAIVLYAFGTVGSAAQQAVILEWHSPDFHTWEVYLFFGPCLLSLALMIVLNRRIRARDAALVFVSVVLSLQSVRNIALFVAAVTPVWIHQADMLLDRWLTTRRGSRRRATVLPPLGMRVAVWGFVMVVVTGAAAVRATQAVTVREDSLFYAKDMPVCATRWLLSAPGHLNILNQYGNGGYLAYKLSAHGDKVFVFGDAALMGDPLLGEYGHIEGVNWDWNKILDDYGTDLIVFDTQAPISNVVKQSARWVTVYSDQHTTVFAPTARVASMHLPPQTPLSSDPADTCSQLAATPALELNQ